MSTVQPLHPLIYVGCKKRYCVEGKDSRGFHVIFVYPPSGVILDVQSRKYILRELNKT